jgi:hypothetical protein
MGNVISCSENSVSFIFSSHLRTIPITDREKLKPDFVDRNEKQVSSLLLHLFK